MPARSDEVALVAVGAAVTAIDQLTKFFLVSSICADQIASRVDVVNGWLALEYTENRGGAFGLLSGLAPLLTAASIAILVGLLWHYTRQEQPPLWHTLAIGGIAGGALGNIIDRVRLGHVVDFLSVGPWPNFNVADSAITVGVLALIWGWTRPATTFDTARVVDQKH
jgi:signal peptidase II